MVVAHDFCEARDLQQALQHAGAKVVGPFNDAASALRSVVSHTISCAVIDLELGDQQELRIASALVDKGTPLVFLSGKAPSCLPDYLKTMPQFFKSPDYRSLVELVAYVAGKSNARSKPRTQQSDL